jgi:hypothetical protein
VLGAEHARALCRGDAYFCLAMTYKSSASRRSMSSVKPAATIELEVVPIRWHDGDSRPMRGWRAPHDADADRSMGCACWQRDSA